MAKSNKINIDKLGSVFERGVSILQKIKDAGYDAYIVGGAIRDAILGRIPTDIDITTNAPAEVIERLFPDFNRKFPPQYEIFSSQKIDEDFNSPDFSGGNNKIEWQIEIARMRIDVKNYGRQADVIFTDDIAEDLKRRDFTINAMAMSSDFDLIDLFGGIEDIEAKLIRTIGIPETRFAEDNLRILRAVRFAARLDFDIEHRTAEAITEMARLVSNLSPYSVWFEFNKGIINPAKFKHLLVRYGIMNELFSSEMKYSSNIEHNLDRIAKKFGDSPILWAFFLMDIPENYSQKIRKICQHIQFPHKLKKSIEQVAEILSSLDNIEYLEPKEQAKILECQYFNETLDAARIYGGFEKAIEKIEKMYPNINAPRLLDGAKILSEMNIEPSMVGDILAKIRLAQFRGEILNEKQALKLARDIIENLN